jgi:DNA replication protein DnaC
MGDDPFSIWLKPNRCSCQGAESYWAEIDYLTYQAAMEKEQEETRQRKQKLLELSRLPKRYWECCFETSKATRDNGAVLDFVRAYAESLPNTEGLFLSGPVGTGKTYLTACLVNHLIEKEIRVLFGNVLDLLGRIRKSYDPETQEEEWRIMDEMAAVPLLIIDDLGKEKVRPWVEQTLYHIVDARYRENKALVVTSNYSLGDLEKRYEEVGPALASRISEMCEGRFLGGQDWRKAGK